MRAKNLNVKTPALGFLSFVLGARFLNTRHMEHRKFHKVLAGLIDMKKNLRVSSALSVRASQKVRQLMKTPRKMLEVGIHLWEA